MPTLRVIGTGRAGTSVEEALRRAGWSTLAGLHHDDDLEDAAVGCDLLVLAVPDGAVAAVALRVTPVASTVVAHLAGSLGLDVLAPHARRASFHPLIPLPTAEEGAHRLVSGAWFAVAGDPLADAVVDALGGRRVKVADEHRVAYHAAACMAANHLVALLGQVERVAATAGVPLAAYLDLARAALDDVASLGPAAALTGPAARGDRDTVARHLAVLPAAERAAYLALSLEAGRLAGRPVEEAVPPCS